MYLVFIILKFLTNNNSFCYYLEGEIAMGALGERGGGEAFEHSKVISPKFKILRIQQP